MEPILYTACHQLLSAAIDACLRVSFTCSVSPTTANTALGYHWHMPLQSLLAHCTWSMSADASHNWHATLEELWIYLPLVPNTSGILTLHGLRTHPLCSLPHVLPYDDQRLILLLAFFHFGPADLSPIIQSKHCHFWKWKPLPLVVLASVNSAECLKCSITLIIILIVAEAPNHNITWLVVPEKTSLHSM